jgi:hypothetical protein
MDMKAIGVVAVIAVLAGPAYGQSKAPTTLEEMMNGKTPEQIEKEQATEKAYRESLKKIPESKTAADPWGNARGADTPGTVAKTPPVRTPAAKPKAKTGSTATGASGN